MQQPSSSSCSFLWPQPFPFSGSTGPAPQWPGCAAMPWAGTLLLSFQVPAWQQGVPGICFSCSPPAVLALKFASLCIPRAALQVREEMLLLPGATPHQHGPLCPQDQFLCCAFQQQAGSCLPCQPLLPSVFLGASLLPHGSISLSNNPNMDPLSNNQNVDHFSRAITQMGVLFLSSHPIVTVQTPPHSRAVPPRLCSDPVLRPCAPPPPPCLSPLQHSSCAAALASSSPSPCEDTIKGLRFHPCSLLPLSGCGTGATRVLGTWAPARPLPARQGTGSTSCSSTALSRGSSCPPSPHWDPSGQHKELSTQAGGRRGILGGRVVPSLRAAPGAFALVQASSLPWPAALAGLVWGLGPSRAPMLGQSS